MNLWKRVDASNRASSSANLENTKRHGAVATFTVAHELHAFFVAALVSVALVFYTN